MKSPAELTDLFRDRGRKMTAQRQALFAILHGTEAHPTAEWVYERARRQMPTISLRTVYQTLNDLVAMGELEQLDVGTGSARFDPNLAPHHHLVCDDCGRVQDVPVDFPDVAVPQEVAGGFTVSTTEIVFRGLCATCAHGTRADGTADRAPSQSNHHPHKECHA
ncbi:MAG: transcriptional repressor [Actinobacteria bacterium]|nr:transcriptional repressor [Actinomycetota bacterium]